MMPRVLTLTAPGRPNSRASRRRWASRRPLRASVARVLADARRQLRRGSLCGCGGDEAAVGNATVWDSSTIPKPPKGQLRSSVGGTAPTPLPPFGGLDGHLDGPPGGARWKVGGASQCYHLRSAVAVNEDDPAAQRDATAVRRDSFSEALKPLVLTSQVFLVMPVRARRWSRLARTIVLLVLISSMAALAALRMMKQGISLTSSSPAVFYGTAALAAYLLANLSSQWPHMLARWRASGSPLTLNETVGTADTKVYRAITVAMLVFALVEHVLSVLADLVPLVECAEQGGVWAVYKSFFVNKFPMVFDVFPFSPAASVLLLYLNLTCTFLWNVIDIVVVVISSLLAGRFRRFNRLLEKARGKDYSKFWWQEVRESYNRLVVVTKHFDAHINGIVLLSFASNLFFICLQLLHNMTKHKNSALAHLYFYLSFAWLLVRTAVVSMSAASVYEQSVVPIEVLYCVPSKSFCVEVQRFLVQVTTDTVALTGCRFFWVTRSLILTLVGTVATYEIVLVQFHSDKSKTEHAGAACSL